RRRSAATTTTSGGTLEAAALPELKRIIVSFGNRVVMREGLEDALYAVLGEQPPADTETAAPAPQSMEFPATQASPEAALKHFNRARELLRQGDWAGYGKELRALEKILNQLAAKGAETGG
ncbi:MAG: hypothetical protein P8Y00_09785, partial [Deltaproteobacteria bacterium]